MGLPIQSTPTYTCVLPSEGREIKYRPFLVKEQKILTIARESEDQKQIFSAVKDLLEAVTTPPVVCNDLAVIDLEYLFLKVRAVSVGETSKVSTKCDVIDCKGSVELTVNLNDIEVVGDTKDDTVMINDSVGIVLSAPAVKNVQGLDGGEADALALIIKSIKQVFDGDELYEASDMSEKDMTEFVESLTFPQLQMLTEYFDSLPKLSHEVEGKCNICDSTTTRTLEGINSFFLIALSHESVFNYYNTNFQLMQHHKYSLTELDNMMPWEREIYISLLMQYLEEEKQRQKEEAAKRK